MFDTAIAIFSVLIELGILKYYLNLLLENKTYGLHSMVIYLVAVIVLSGLSIANMKPYWRTAIYLVIVIIIAILTCQGVGFWKILIACCFIYYFAGVEICAYSALLFLQLPAHLLYVCGVLASKIMSILTVQYLAQMLTKTYHYVSRTERYVILLMPFGITFTMYVMLEMSLLTGNKRMFLLAALCACILMGGMQAALYFFNRQLDRDQLQKQVDIQKCALTNKVEYEKKMGVVRQMGHDLKNILTVLAAYIKERQCDEALEYIQAKGVQLQENKMIYTNNELLNNLLANKLLLARERKLDIKVTNAVKEYAISLDDLLLILAEALDNAIENACSASTIDVVIEQKGNFMKLAVRNRVKNKVVITDGKIKTKKADQERHGYGINGMRTIVSKYGGDLQLLSSEDQFTCLILVPHPGRE